MAIYTDKRFDSGEVQLKDGDQFIHCTFLSGATLIYDGGDVLVHDCVIHPQCGVRFAGPAHRTVGFLRMLRTAQFDVDTMTGGHKKGS